MSREYIPAGWSSSEQNYDGTITLYSRADMEAAQKRIAALEAQNALLRALYERHKHLDMFLSDEKFPPIGRTGSAILYELWEFIKQAAIDDGALASQWQQTTDKILDERHELWQQLADSDDGALEEGE